ncbi:MAG: tRNA (adenosine(37)-N6)-dimethylallyltransferase MiaA [Bacteroidia bacterium]
MPEKCLIAIVGPTASGKSELAVQLAEHYRTEIISVDARQLFRETDKATAKPTSDQLSRAKHHFINSHSIFEDYSAARFGHEARAVLEHIFQQHDIAIAAGGSTLYYQAFLDGLDDMPPSSKEAIDKVQQLFDDEGLKGLQDALYEVDTEYMAGADIQNHRRLMRALEVYYSSGKPFSSFFNQSQSQTQNRHIYQTVKIGLDVPRDVLYERINRRCDEMLTDGLMEEVEALYTHKHLRAMQTVGYQEFFRYMDGEMTLPQAIDKFKQHTRNYAKRQLTWFRRDPEIKWFSPEDMEGITRFVDNKCSQL